jgi:hypothetical protein
VPAVEGPEKVKHLRSCFIVIAPIVSSTVLDTVQIILHVSKPDKRVAAIMFCLSTVEIH